MNDRTATIPPPSAAGLPTRAEAIFCAALEQPPERRAAYVTRECGGQEPLLARVHRLLAAHEQAGAFMDEAGASPIFGDTVVQSSAEQPGEPIGPYKLLQRIGEGGFGSVWMAEQTEPVTRRVALKIIKLGMDTKDVIARFEAERQAPAMMDHPNIAKVLDAGATDKGRPFFVMELVKGVPITQYCDEAGLGTRERLALFGDVCSAINHSHQKGIIHRDIKPSNVMVTMHGDKAVVKVIDFGIAKATQGKLTDKTLFTRFEQVIGTPVYMSPEQAATSGLDIDTRSDIYGLGILLYELLTGKPPFDAMTLASAGYEEMRRIIREVEPPKPSARLSTIAGEERTTLAKARHIEPEKLGRMVEPDLDWIVMKAIEKDRSRRYDTANGLALDIPRFLSDEPVSATPPSAAYKFRKFARRNKTALRVAAGIVLLLLAATAVSTWQAVRATRAERLAGERLAEVGRERDAKEKARQDAEAISTFLAEIFESPDPGRDGREIRVAELLDRVAGKLDKDLAVQAGQRTLLQETLGNTFHALGLYPEALKLREQVRDYRAAALGPEHPDTLSAMRRMAISLADMNRRDEAIRMNEEILAASRRVLGPEHPDTLFLAGNLAADYRDAGRFREALKIQEELLAVCRRVFGPHNPDDFVFSTMRNLATSLDDAGRYEEAARLREEALEGSRRTFGPESVPAIQAMDAVALSFDLLGRKKEALRLWEEAMPLFLKVFGPDHPATLSAGNNMTESLFKAGRRAEAISRQEAIVDRCGRVLGPQHRQTLLAKANLASLKRNAGNLEQAYTLMEELVPLFTGVFGLQHPRTLEAKASLAKSSAEAGQSEKALAIISEVLAASRERLGVGHPDTLRYTGYQARLLYMTGHLEEALELGETALEGNQKALGPEHPQTVSDMANLAVYLEADGRSRDAMELRDQVLTLHRKALGPEHPETLGAMTNLAISYAGTGRLDEAVELQEQSLAIKRRVLPPSHPFVAAALHNLAHCYEKTGRKEEAEALRKELTEKGFAPPSAAAPPAATPAPSAADLGKLEEALASVRTTKGMEAPESLGALTDLVAAQVAAGNGGKAIKIGEEALALARRLLPAGDGRITEVMTLLIAAYRSVDLEDAANNLEAALRSASREKPDEASQ